jgi:hypothetical protein
MHTILLLILIVLMTSALPTWPYGAFGRFRDHRPRRSYSATRPVREPELDDLPPSAWAQGELCGRSAELAPHELHHRLESQDWHQRLAERFDQRPHVGVVRRPRLSRDESTLAPSPPKGLRGSLTQPANGRRDLF